MVSKRRPSCGETELASDFGRNRPLPGGRSSYFLACNREGDGAWYRERRRSLGKEVRDHSWIPEGFRWCPSCGQPVPYEDYTRNSRTASGFGSRCRACARAANSAGYFYRKYKLRKNEVADLKAAQDGRCAICSDPAQHLDHDHATGATRQLLRQRCNHGLGLFRDDPVLLDAAACYVAFHRARQELVSGAAPDTASRTESPPVGS